MRRVLSLSVILLSACASSQASFEVCPFVQLGTSIHFVMTWITGPKSRPLNFCWAAEAS